MSEPLEELRAQRALIQKHLDWLDAQIKSAEGLVDQPTPSTDQPVVEAAVGAPPTRTQIIITEEDAPTSIETLGGFDEERHLATSTSDVKRAQIGCFLIFVVGILLFLFLLFGLPYLMD
jgi:hypothetical protein